MLRPAFPPPFSSLSSFRLCLSLRKERIPQYGPVTVVVELRDGRWFTSFCFVWNSYLEYIVNFLCYTITTITITIITTNTTTISIPLSLHCFSLNERHCNSSPCPSGFLCPLSSYASSSNSSTAYLLSASVFNPGPPEPSSSQTTGINGKLGTAIRECLQRYHLSRPLGKTSPVGCHHERPIPIRLETMTRALQVRVIQAVEEAR